MTVSAAPARSSVRPVVFERIDPSAQIGWRPLRAVALAGFAALAIVVLALAWSDPMATCALPALVLPAMFLLRRYPGARMLAVLSQARRRCRARPRSSMPLASRPEAAVPRGGLLLARSLAVRPPPVSSLPAG